MTNLEAVLAGDWPDDLDPLSPEADRLRSAADRLGRWALAMVLRVEVDLTRCPVCNTLLAAMDSHRDDCEWGRLCEEARKLG